MQFRSCQARFHFLTVHRDHSRKLTTVPGPCAEQGIDGQQQVVKELHIGLCSVDNNLSTPL